MAIVYSDTKTFGVTNTDSPRANISKPRVQRSCPCDFIPGTTLEFGANDTNGVLGFRIWGLYAALVPFIFAHGLSVKISRFLVLVFPQTPGPCCISRWDVQEASTLVASSSRNLWGDGLLLGFYK